MCVSCVRDFFVRQRQNAGKPVCIHGFFCETRREILQADDLQCPWAILARDRLRESGRNGLAVPSHSVCGMEREARPTAGAPKKRPAWSRAEGKKHMSIESVKGYLEPLGLADRVMEFEQSSATVAEAAADLGCEPAHIAKTMAFVVDGHAVLVVMAGDGKVDNPRFKAQFHTKAVMVRPEELVARVGHPMGGVCPFAVHDDVPVYLDESLRRFAVIYPAAGTAASAVRLSVPELERSADNLAGWVDIAKGWREGE